MSESFPEKSTGSIGKGVWFVFPTPTGTVRVFSGLTGRERVYLDTALVSERGSMKRTSLHTFEAGGVSYEAELHVEGILKGAIRCTVTRNGERIGRQVSGVQGGFGWRVWLAVVAVVAVLVGASRFLGWTDLVYPVLFVMYVVLLVVEYKRMSVVITED